MSSAMHACRVATWAGLDEGLIRTIILFTGRPLRLTAGA